MAVFLTIPFQCAVVFNSSVNFFRTLSMRIKVEIIYDMCNWRLELEDAMELTKVLFVNQSNIYVFVITVVTSLIHYPIRLCIHNLDQRDKRGSNVLIAAPANFLCPFLKNIF